MRTLTKAKPKSELHKWYNDRGLTRARNAMIMEDYIANRFTIDLLAQKWKLSRQMICGILTLYFKKPDVNLYLKSKV